MKKNLVSFSIDQVKNSFDHFGGLEKYLKQFYFEISFWQLSFEARKEGIYKYKKDHF